MTEVDRFALLLLGAAVAASWAAFVFAAARSAVGRAALNRALSVAGLLGVVAGSGAAAVGARLQFGAAATTFLVYSVFVTAAVAVPAVALWGLRTAWAAAERDADEIPELADLP